MSDLRKAWAVENKKFVALSRILGTSTPGVSILFNDTFIPISTLIRREVPMGHLLLACLSENRFKL